MLYVWLCDWAFALIFNVFLKVLYKNIYIILFVTK